MSINTIAFSLSVNHFSIISFNFQHHLQYSKYGEIKLHKDPVLLHFMKYIYLFLLPGVLTQSLSNQLIHIHIIPGWVNACREGDI